MLKEENSEAAAAVCSSNLIVDESHQLQRMSENNTALSSFSGDADASENGSVSGSCSVETFLSSLTSWEIEHDLACSTRVDQKAP